MNHKPLPSQERIHQLFYCVNGVLIRKVVPPHCRFSAGDRAGNKNKVSGYWEVSIDGKTYSQHRVVYKFYMGIDPIDCIDHIDGDKNNNNIYNLRDVNVMENNQNTKGRRERGFNTRRKVNGRRVILPEAREFVREQLKQARYRRRKAKSNEGN